MTPSQIRLAFDSGWSDGDPGDGRVRFNSPKVSAATSICINARDAQDALLDQLVPSWRVGDVLVIERPGADRNRVVAWIIGPITHGGSYYKVPILPRSVHGAFAAHDELVLHHHTNLVDTDEPERREWHPPKAAPVAPSSQPISAPAVNTLAPLAPMALTQAHPMQPAAMPVASPPAPPMAPMAPAGLTPAASPEVESLKADNAALHGIIAELLADETELYAVETSP